MMSRFSTSVLIAFAVISVTACSFNPMKLVANNDLKSLSFTTLANANQGAATAIDVVFIGDTKVIEKMPKTSAVWFSQKHTLLNNHALGILSIEMAPLTMLKNMTLPKDHADAVAIFVYFNMSTEQPFMRIPAREKCVHITLAEQGVKYATCH